MPPNRFSDMVTSLLCYCMRRRVSLPPHMLKDKRIKRTQNLFYVFHKPAKRAFTQRMGIHSIYNMQSIPLKNDILCTHLFTNHHSLEGCHCFNHHRCCQHLLVSTASHNEAALFISCNSSQTHNTGLVIKSPIPVYLDHI
jgi:hypothetical protein